MLPPKPAMTKKILMTMNSTMLTKLAPTLSSMIFLCLSQSNCKIVSLHEPLGVSGLRGRGGAVPWPHLKLPGMILSKRQEIIETTLESHLALKKSLTFQSSEAHPTSISTPSIAGKVRTHECSVAS